MDSANNFKDVVVGVNTSTNDILGISLLVIVFAIVFMKVGSNSGSTNGFIASSLSSTIIGSLLWFMGILSCEILIIPTMLFFGSVIVYYFKR